MHECVKFHEMIRYITVEKMYWVNYHSALKIQNQSMPKVLKKLKIFFKYNTNCKLKGIQTKCTGNLIYKK